MFEFKVVILNDGFSGSRDFMNQVKGRIERQSEKRQQRLDVNLLIYNSMT